jgi:hypothetical protein
VLVNDRPLDPIDLLAIAVAESPGGKLVVTEVLR